MPVLILSALRTQTGRSVVVLWFSLGMGPALMSYYSLRHVTRQSNVCFIGPTMLTMGSDEEDIGTEEEGEEDEADREAQYSQQREPPLTESDVAHHSVVVLPSEPKSSPPDVDELLHQLYGSYHAFDGASYYYVKTPVEENDSDEDSFGLSLSGTSLLSGLSPRAVERRKQQWKLQDVQQQRRQQLLPSGERQTRHGGRRKAVRRERRLQESNHFAPLFHSSISWDRGHRHDTGGLLNRWCASLTNDDYSSVLLRYCTDTVPSVVADAGVDPHFPELPLDPPPRHRPWKLSEGSAVLFDSSESSLLPPLPWEISVECHLRWGAVPNVHYGPILEDDEPPLRPSPWRLPGTVLLIVVHTVAYLVQRRRSHRSPPGFSQLRNRAVAPTRAQSQNSSDDHDNEEDEADDEDGDFAAFDDNLLNHALDHQHILHFVFVIWNLWWLGVALEEDFSTLPYLAWHVSLLFLCTLVSWLWTQRRPLVTCLGRFMRRIMRQRHASSAQATEEQNQWKGHVSPPTATCGHYTSVLLAWMAVASCERREISPFPLLLPHWSISTLDDLLGQAVSPLLLVNLVLIVTVVARSSPWASHAGGLLCGYSLVHPSSHNPLSPPFLVPGLLLLIHWFWGTGGAVIVGSDGPGQKSRCKSEDMEFQKNRESGSTPSPQRRTDNTSNGTNKTASKAMENFAASIPESDEEMMMLMEDVILNDSVDDGDGRDDIGDSNDTESNALSTSPAASFLNLGERTTLQILRVTLWICVALSFLWLDYGVTARHVLVVLLFHRTVRQILAWEQQSSLNVWGSTLASCVSSSSYFAHGVLWVLAADAATVGAWIAAPTLVTSSAARTFHNSNMTAGLCLLVARFVFNALAVAMVSSITTATDGSPTASTPTILRYLLSCATLVGDTIRRVLCRKNIQR